MSDSAVLLIVLIGSSVFVVVFGIAMFYLVRRQGLERRKHGGITRGSDSIASDDSSVL